MDFLKNMFSKPVVLWTAGEELVMGAFILLGLVLLFGTPCLVSWIVYKRKKNKRKKKNDKVS